MAWHIPQTEEEWAECLSAYLDNELDAESRTALETHMQTNPKRMAQLQSYRQTSSLLQTWTVDAPAPSRAFLQRISRESVTPNHASTVWQWFDLPRFQWGQFAFGVVAGMFALLIVQAALPIDRSVRQGEQQPNSASVYSVSLSQNQADKLLLEVTANGLVSDLKQQIRSRHWDKAAKIYQSLEQDYGNTKAFSDAKNTPALQTIMRNLSNPRSI